MAHNSYTMCICSLPDMHTFSPQVCGPQVSGVHIRQTTRAHGVANYNISDGRYWKI